LLQRRITAELTQIEAVQRDHAKRVGIVPWMTEEPVGPERLLRLARYGRAKLESAPIAHHQSPLDA
ncbi:MAG: hypothetical protein ACXWIM_23975, partial [Burkholderiales bacterium]